MLHEAPLVNRLSHLGHSCRLAYMMLISMRPTSGVAIDADIDAQSIDCVTYT